MDTTITLPASHEARKRLWLNLKPLRRHEMTANQLQQRQALRLWIASGYRFPRWKPLKAEPVNFKPVYLNGRCVGMAEVPVATSKPVASTTAACGRPNRRPSRARAKARTRSFSRAGDSGDDDADHERLKFLKIDHALESVMARRLCACGCGLSVDHMRRGAKYYDDTCRQRGHRGSEPVDPYLVLTVSEWEWLKHRLSHCRCNGRHLLDGEDGNCIKCGLPYRDNVPRYYELIVWDRATSKRSPIPSSIANLQSQAVTA